MPRAPCSPTGRAAGSWRSPSPRPTRSTPASPAPSRQPAPMSWRGCVPPASICRAWSRPAGERAVASGSAAAPGDASRRCPSPRSDCPGHPDLRRCPRTGRASRPRSSRTRGAPARSVRCPRPSRRRRCVAGSMSTRAFASSSSPCVRTTSDAATRRSACSHRCWSCVPGSAPRRWCSRTWCSPVTAPPTRPRCRSTSSTCSWTRRQPGGRRRVARRRVPRLDRRAAPGPARRGAGAGGARATRSTVRLHARLAVGPFGELVDHDELRGRSVPVQLGGSWARALRPDDRFVLTCLALGPRPEACSPWALRRVVLAAPRTDAMQVAALEASERWGATGAVLAAVRAADDALGGLSPWLVERARREAGPSRRRQRRRG